MSRRSRVGRGAERDRPARARPHGGFRAVGWVGVINPAFACGSGEGWVDQANPAYVNFSWERLQPRALRSEDGWEKLAAEAAPTRGARGNQRLQIGRASCREGVCQYV